MKGVEPLIAAVFIIIISIAGIAIVLESSQPSISRLKEISLLEEAKKILTQVDNAVRSVGEEGEGSTRVLQLSVSDGNYVIDTDKDAVTFSMDSKSQVIGRGVSKIEGNVNMYGELNRVLMNISYSTVNITGGGSFGRGIHSLIIRNDGYDVVNQKQIISISLAPPVILPVAFINQYNQFGDPYVVKGGTPSGYSSYLNELGEGLTYDVPEAIENSGTFSYSQFQTANISGENTTSAENTFSIDNVNYNVTSTFGMIGGTFTDKYNQTQTTNITGINRTSPNYLNVIDGQSYNVTENGTTVSRSDTSSDLESGTIQKKVSTSVTSYNVKTGAINTGTTATTVTFSNAMPSASYSVLISGSTDSDTMYSMAYLNKGTNSFQIKAEDDAGSGEASTNAQWMAIEFGDNTFNGIPIKCGTNSSAIVSGTNTINFPSAFSNASYVIITNPIDNADSPLINYISGSKTTTTMQIRIENDAGAAQTLAQFNYCGFIMGEYTLGSINIKARSATTAASGDTTVTFGTAFPSTSYTVVAMAQSTAGAQCAPEVVTKNVGSFTIHFEHDAGANCANRPFDWLAITTGENTIDTSIPVIDQNTTYTTYNNVYSGSVLDTIINISVTVNVSKYNNTGSNGKNSNPDLWLEIYNGATWTEIGNMSVSGISNFTKSTIDSTILSAWQTPANRNIRIKGRYFDANATTWDEINYTDVWVKIDSKKTTYRAEVEHNATGVTWSGTLNNISISINFSTNVTSIFNLTIFNFNSGIWDYTVCQDGTVNANTWYNWWCNVTINPSYYISSTGVIRIRLNGTEHSSYALVREEYVQYYISSTVLPKYANISVEHNSSTISEDPSSITKINVTTILKTNISSGVPFDFYIYNFSSGSWESCLPQALIDTNYKKMECVILSNPSYYISDGKIRVRLNSSGDTASHQMMEDYLVYQITSLTTYRVEIWHISSQIADGNISFINATVNFTTNVSDMYSLQIYDWLNSQWSSANCDSGNVPADTPTMWWCNETSNPMNYNSSDRKVKIRINSTADNDNGLLKEDYVQYFIGYAQ